MTDQVYLDKVWALTGGVTDPGAVKYSAGWIAEIPTFQNFNYVLQVATTNFLALAESGSFTWQTEISYKAGAEVYEGTVKYFCILANTGNQPSLDTTESYWVKVPKFGTGTPNKLHGLSVRGATARLDDGTWTASDATLQNKSAVLQLNTDGATKNWLIANVKGEIVVVDCDLLETADGRDIDPATGAKSFRVFHEGHFPTVAEVTNAVEEAPQDGKAYSRSNASWAVTTTITASASPPAAVAGNGAGWYNLDDGQLYIDIDDGDSSQWTLANSPRLENILLTTETGVTAYATGGQANAVELVSEVSEVTTVASANDSVKLPPGVAGARKVVLNTGANSLAIFPATGEQLRLSGINNSVSLATDTLLSFVCYVDGKWARESNQSIA